MNRREYFPWAHEKNRDSQFRRLLRQLKPMGHCIFYREMDSIHKMQHSNHIFFEFFRAIPQ